MGELQYYSKIQELDREVVLKLIDYIAIGETKTVKGISRSGGKQDCRFRNAFLHKKETLRS